MTIGVYTVDLAKIPQAAKVAILGAGPIGLAVLIALRAKGIDHISLTEPLAYRRELALANGVINACDPYLQPINQYFPEKFDNPNFNDQPLKNFWAKKLTFY